MSVDELIAERHPRNGCFIADRKRFRHSERLENVLPYVRIVRFVGNGFDDAAQNNVVRIAIAPRATRSKLQRFAGDTRHKLIVCGRLARVNAGNVEIVGEAAGLRQ